MIDTVKERILGTVEVVLLIIMILVRFFSKDESGNWISQLNYIGLFIAYILLYLDLCSEFFHNRKFSVITGGFVVVLIGLTIILALILSNQIILTPKANDLILLFTLLISLPIRFYKNLVSDYLKK